MIYRFEANPPVTDALIYADPNRALGGINETDGRLPFRMIGGRNDLGENLGPCIATVDDETERGRWELENIQRRLAEGRLPGITPYEPATGLSDTQIEAMIERRVQEELAKRGYVEQPSDEMREELFGPTAEANPPWIEVEGRSPAAIDVQSLEVIETGDGRKQCPLDGKLFKLQGWWQHWRYSQDPHHQRLADQMLGAAPVA